MTFADLPAGNAVFLDANTLVYHYQPHPTFGSACKALLDRIELGELSGFTSTHIVAEVAHRLMTLEASSTFAWRSKVVQRLKQRPADVQKLSQFRLAIERIPQVGIQVLTVPASLVSTAPTISQQTGLLTNDAILVAVMQHYKLIDLASHDADFDRVPGITRYGPA